VEHIRTSKEELDRMIRKATVDCYNEDEAFMGVVYYLADRMSFPFKAKWIGDVVEVMGIDDEESEIEGEVITTIRTEDDEYTIGLDELETMSDDIENGKYFEMYKYWIGEFEPY